MAVVSGSTREALDAITARNALTSPLLRLPAELRSMIWNYSITDKVYIVSTKRSIFEPSGQYVRLRPLSPPPGWVGLLRASRQIHSETANLPLPLNSFHISSPEHLECLSHTLARSRIPITKLRLDVKPRFELWRDRFLLPKILPHLKLLEVTFCSHRMNPRLVNIEFLHTKYDQKRRKWFEDGCKGLLELVVLESQVDHDPERLGRDSRQDSDSEGF
ncbi:hypothetical protein HBI70_021740 [Parastagonospora nodorum]|nr:hypothetical protein HBI70_021740 [Parastagonospora nodorum]